MAVSKYPYIQIQLVYIGSLPKVHKLRICVPPHFLAPSYATDIVSIVLKVNTNVGEGRKEDTSNVLIYFQHGE